MKKTQMTTKKKVLMSTLIPLSAAIVATSIAVPLVLLKKNPVEPEPTPTPSKDKETVTKLNNLLATAKEEGLTFDTMSALVAYLSLHEVDLETLAASDTDQYVWDSKNNVICTLKTTGELSCGPDGYTLNQNKYEIWKLVNLPTSSRLFSSTNGTTETFDANSSYGQYLKSGQIIPTEQITFSCSIDTGSNEDLKLKYVGDSEQITYTPKVVTYCADLEVDGSIKNIEHYGHAKSITVTELGDEGTYTEYGTVDSDIIVKGVNEVTVVAAPSSDVNTIIVDNPNVSIEIKATEDEAATVGSIARTENVEAEQIEVTIDPEVPTEQQPDPVYEEESTPLPTEDSDFAGGLGTVKSPYIIKTSKQLFNCAAYVNGTSTPVQTMPDGGWGFKLSSNITIEYDAENTTWTPIGSSSSKAFKGTFDGNGYTISNLKVSGNLEGAGLFGWTDGTKTDNFEIYEVWDEDKNEIILDKLLENNYPTSVKNITISDADIQIAHAANSNADDGYYVGSIIGYAKNTFIFNNVVKTGTISGYKHVGGITGTMDRSNEMYCMAGSNDTNVESLNITAAIYNAGGITGSCNRGAITSTALIGCETGSNTTVKALNNNGGCVGGICGYDNNIYRKIVVGCTNNAAVETTCTSLTDNGTFAAGICAAGSGTDIFANCTNNGTITTSSGSKAGQLAGITTKPSGNSAAIIKNCVNNGTVKGYATEGVAGVITDWTVRPIIYGCSCPSTVTVENTNDNPTYTTLHSYSQLKEVSFENKTFANVDAVNAAIAEKVTSDDYQMQLTFKNCTVTNNSGTLALPTNIHYADVTSDVQLATDVKVTTYTRELFIDMPQTNINVTENTEADINCYGSNSNITIAQNAKIFSAFISGENSTIENNGTVERTIGLDGAAKSAVNNGSCDDIAFGKTIPISCDKTFTNNGTVIGEYAFERSNNNVVYAEGDMLAQHNITIENKGSISYATDPVLAETPSTPFFNINSELINMVVKCYNGSKLINEKDNWFSFYGTASSIVFKHSDTGVELKENGSDLTFEALAAKSKYVTEETLA